MNAQTPAKRLYVVKHPSRSDCLSVTDGLNHLAECASYEATATPERLSQIKSDAILFAASYTAFDQAGRELGIDAAELARAVDLAALIRATRDLRKMVGNVLTDSQLDQPHKGGARAKCATTIRATLKPLDALLAKLPR